MFSDIELLDSPMSTVEYIPHDICNSVSFKALILNVWAHTWKHNECPQENECSSFMQLFIEKEVDVDVLKGQKGVRFKLLESVDNGNEKANKEWRRYKKSGKWKVKGNVLVINVD